MLQRARPPTPAPDLPSFDRTRLVRLCAYLTGAPEAAEDLAQETLLEAWRNAHKVYDVQGYDRWLGGIARNVCLRWRRQQGRDLAREAEPETETERPDDVLDLEVELERGELATLLDRALALLPAETRAALIEKYVFDSSLAEAAQRLGLSEGNVAVRLHRGKLTLHQLFQTTLKQDALDFGLLPSAETLQPTRLWCPACGQHLLEGRLDVVAGDLLLRCPSCYRARGITVQRSQGLPQVFKGAKSFRAAFTRSLKWSDRLITEAQRTGHTTCVYCGRPVPPRIVATPLGWQWDASCSACLSVNRHHLRTRLMASAIGLSFSRKHPRRRRLQEHDIEAEGMAAILTGWESVTSGARLELLVARNTFDILRILRND